MLKEAKPSKDVIAIKGWETFAQVANGRTTKIIIPSNLQDLAGLATSFIEVAKTPIADEYEDI